MTQRSPHLASPTGEATSGEARRAELGRRLSAVRERIAAACAAVGRDPAQVSLLAVTKTVSATDVATLIDLGLDAFGENRVQEATAKVAEVARLRPGARPRWHMIGRLQRNKVRATVEWADRVESVDSIRLADALDRAVRRAIDEGRRSEPLPVLVQYSVDGDPNRGGAPDGIIDELADHVAGLSGLRLDGVMAVAPQHVDRERAFSAISAAAARIRTTHPDAELLSAGMSGDLEVAIRYGSHVVRVGTALVGERRIASP